MRLLLPLWLLLVSSSLAWSQEQATQAATAPAAKDAFAENAPLRDVKFDQARYNAKQQRLREHHLEVPIGPLPEARRLEAVPVPPPPTSPRQETEAGLNIQLTQNRALTDAETANATSNVCEPSLAVRGREILYTGNWFACFSRDNGTTFQFRNPETMFPAIPNRPFCCDQVAYYVPSHDLMVWFLQHVKDSTGNTVRLAVAHGADIAAERWHYYDFTPQNVGGWSSEWFDYPDIGASAKFLFITTNSFNMSDRFQRSVTLRIPLDELKAYGPLNYRHFNRTDVGSLRLAQGSSNTMYIGTHVNTGTIRVFAWEDNSNSIRHKDFNVQSWVRGGASAPGLDGRDWLGFVDGRITAAWARGRQQGFAWTSAQGGSFPMPNVRAVIVDWDAGTVAQQPHIWNSRIAFAYPAAAVNAAGQVGVSVAYGGGEIYPSHAVGALQSDFRWALVTTANGTNGPDRNRWGDYLTVRTNGSIPSRFACTGFALAGGPNRTDIVPRLTQFDVIPSGGPTPPSSHAALKIPQEPELAPKQPAGPSKTGQDAMERGYKFRPEMAQRNRAKMMQMQRVPSRRAAIAVEALNDSTYQRLSKLPPAASFFYDPPETICFPDDRLQQFDTTAEPWCINCQLIITFRNGEQALGTGWLMGPRLVVTAGHCVHEGQDGDFFQSIEVIPGMSGATRPFGSQVSTVFRASEGWRTFGSSADDYGAIILPREFRGPDGRTPGQLPIQVLSDAELRTQQVTISGYPADKPFGTQWYNSGLLDELRPTRLLYSIDTAGGHSGSPVVATLGGQMTALGIHNYGGCPNKCTRITTKVKADLDHWLAESNGVSPMPDRSAAAGK